MFGWRNLIGEWRNSVSNIWFQLAFTMRKRFSESWIFCVIYRKQTRFHNQALMCITQYTFNSFLEIYARKNAQFKFTDDHKNENEIAVKDIVMLPLPSLHSLSPSWNFVCKCSDTKADFLVDLYTSKLNSQHLWNSIYIAVCLFHLSRAEILFENFNFTL